MLRNINLDDEKFSEILEAAKNRIPELTSEWTDFNAHDPGITFLELFAWKKEMQQFRMDRIGKRHRLKYLELLGSTPRERKQAEALLHIPCSKELLLPKGTAFYAGEIRFETEEEEYLGTGSIDSISCQTEDSGDEAEEMSYVLRRIRGRLGIALFGSPAAEGSSFTLHFTEPLKKEALQHIYFQLRETDKRNAFDDGFSPLAAVHMEMKAAQGWKEIIPIRDETHAFLTSGRIAFRLPEEMAETEEGYLLRFQLKEAGYDTIPVLEHIGIHRVKVVQRHTLAACQGLSEARRAGHSEECCDSYRREGDFYRLLSPDAKKHSGKENPENAELLAVHYDKDFYEQRILAKGTGFPYQRYSTEIADLSSEDLRLLAEKEPGSHCFMEWKQVLNLDASKPEDLHFVLEDGSILFGNGYRGAMPEGEIRIISCHTCLGDAGNVRANTITHCADTRITSIDHAAATGGAKRETIDEAMARTRAELAETTVAVTLQDYEDLARMTPGLCIKACSADTAGEKENRIIISVAPGEKRVKATPAYLENVRQYVEKRSPLGTEVVVIPCRNVGISVFLEVSSKAYGETVKKQVLSKLQEYFEKRSNQAGGKITKSELYGILEQMTILLHVRSISLEARDGGTRKNENGDLQLPPGGLAWLKELQCMVSSAE